MTKHDFTYYFGDYEEYTYQAEEHDVYDALCEVVREKYGFKSEEDKEPLYKFLRYIFEDTIDTMLMLYEDEMQDRLEKAAYEAYADDCMDAKFTARVGR